jgi:hypothetical protein
MIKVFRLLHHILIVIVLVLVIETPTLNVQFRDEKLEGGGGSRGLIVAVPCDNGNGRRGKPLGRSCARFQCLNLAISRWSIRDQRIEQFLRDLRYPSDGASESLFVRLGRFGEAAQFSNELKRRGANLFLRGRWREVMKRFDVSTHKSSFCS